VSLSSIEQPVIAGELSLVDVATLMVRHFKLHEGLYDPSFKVQVAVGHIGGIPAAAAGEMAIASGAGTAYPGAVMTIQGLALNKVSVRGPHTVDAAVVNPAPQARAAESHPRAGKAIPRTKAKA
jgi:hypothetical protein